MAQKRMLAMPTRRPARARFAEYMPKEEYEPLLADGALLTGTLRINGSKINEGYVSVDGIETDVFIDGMTNRNRAYDGDVVVVELLPVSRWRTITQPERVLPAELEDDEADDAADDASDEGDDAPEVPSSSPSSSAAPSATQSPEPKSELARISSLLHGSGSGEAVVTPQPVPISVPQQVAEMLAPSHGLSLTTSTESIPPIASEQRKSKLSIIRRSAQSPPPGFTSPPAPATPPPSPAAPHSVSPASPVPDMKAKLLADMKERVAAARRKPELGEGQKQPLGIIVAILEDNHTAVHSGYISTCSDGESFEACSDEGYFMFRPIDKRVPWALVRGRFEPVFREALSAMGPKISEALFLAELQPWEIIDRRPGARILKLLGRTGDVESETKAILLEYGIDEHEFSPEVNACLPKVPWQIPEEELRSRRDFRSARIFTCDPLTARDLDDALSCWPLPDGTFEVGVHIADVAHFVRPGTALDAEAQLRSTSVYLVQKVIPMLPRVLCEDLCSLNPGADRFAFSCLWRMTADGEILSEWFGRSMIRSCCKLNYGLVQAALDGLVGDGQHGWAGAPADVVPPWAAVLAPHTTAEVVTDIRNMARIARKLRARRVADGSISIGSCKLYIALDEAGRPVDAVPYELHESNELIEDMMLLANRRVAIRIAESIPDAALLRRHPPPNQRKIKEFAEFCAREKLGTVDSATSGSLARSLAAIRASNPLPYIGDILTYFSVKPMQLAKYFSTGSLPCDQWRHYALAMDHYTHFTSPIRRYPDVVVHRQLDASIAMEAASRSLDAARQLPSNVELSKICRHSNDKKLSARKVQEASGKLFLCLLVSDAPATTDGIVLGFTDRYISVYVPKYVFEKRVYLEDMPLLDHEYSQESGTLTLRWSTDPAWRPPSDDDLEDTMTGPERLALRARRQLEFYFSKQNLARDTFMKNEMAKRPDKGILLTVLLTFKKLAAIVGNDASIIRLAAESSKFIDTSDDGLCIIPRPTSRPFAAAGSSTSTSTSSQHPEQPCIIQKIGLFNVINASVSVRPNKRPLEPRISIVHPVEGLQQQWQKQWQQKPKPAVVMTSLVADAQDLVD